MSFATALIDTHPKDGMPQEVLADCIRACVDCTQACTACADACLGESDPKTLDRCIRLNLDCADLCQSAARIISRLTALDREMAIAALQASATACRICADECAEHAGMEHCRICADACQACEQACQALIGAL